MKHGFMHAVGLVAAAALALGAGPAVADAVGPYYATPSWDQTLPASTRFIVLLNFNSEAVLDRETGLVWEKSPSTFPGFAAFTTRWDAAITFCPGKSTGGRYGWHLPAFEELASLADPSTGLPAGHPFVGVTTNYYWSTTLGVGPILAGTVFAVRFGPGPDAGRVSFIYPGILAGENASPANFWCVRGGHGPQFDHAGY